MTSTDTTAAATVYTTASCTRCRMTIKRLDALGIDYRVVDLTGDADARDRLVAAGFASAPVVETADGRTWSGFRPDRLTALADNAGCRPAAA